jgi:hypothetical protein
MDTDFDGFLNQTDLKKFIINTLLVQRSKVNPIKLDRLMRLLDQHKKGCIHLTDIKEVFDNDFNSARNLTVTGFNKLDKTLSRSTFDWRINARQ